MTDFDPLFLALSKSKFRSRFRLKDKDLQYLRDKGLSAILEHARDFIGKRLAPELIENDGKQTPYLGHPVFVAQHATACCCRTCLQKWHGIDSRHALTLAEQAYILAVLERWLSEQGGCAGGVRDDAGPQQMTLPGF
ncbi:MAG: DUF4186 domain-containing protein [Gammaproteobacteria bacterium]